jgi:hypothetical protein
MKNSGLTIVFIIVCIVVLFVSYGVGLCIREVRFRHAAAVTSKTNVQSQISAEAQKPGNIIEPVNKPTEDVQASSEEKQTPNNEGRRRFGSLSEEEMTQMRNRWQNMSDEERQQERERRRAEMAEMRAKMESMSEEEREQFRNEMRQRFGGDRQFPGRRPGRGQQQSEPNE